MSVSGVFSWSVSLVPTASRIPSSGSSGAKIAPWNGGGSGAGGGLEIECSSRPQKKATAHHIKTRPRKTRPWDIRRKPTVYPPLPTLPPDWTMVESSESGDGSPAAVAAPPVSLEAPPSTE